MGEGAISNVYLVRDKKEEGSVWALKQLNHFSSSEEREALKKEAEMLSSLRHDNLIKLVECFSEEGYDYLVMERVIGPTLQEIIENLEEPVPEKDFVDYGVQMVQVLTYLHSQDPPVIYRDLKPGNIMITVQEQVKLIDLGIVRHFNPMKPKDTTPMGTPGYCPPEQYGTGQTTMRSDIYSFGAVAYHTLTGKDPAEFKFDFPPASRYNPMLTDKMEEIIMKCLQLNPDNRYHHFSQLYDHLIEHQIKLKKEYNNAGFKLKSSMNKYRHILTGLWDSLIKYPGSKIK